MKELSILSYTYGVGNFPIISSIYHNNKEKNIANFFPNQAKVDMELVDKICEAIKSGYKIDYNENPTNKDLK